MENFTWIEKKKSLKFEKNNKSALSPHDNIFIDNIVNQCLWRPASIATLEWKKSMEAIILSMKYGTVCSILTLSNIIFLLHSIWNT